MRLKKWKVDLLAWFLAKSGLGYLFVLHEELGSDDHKGCVLWTGDDDAHLGAILHSSLENCPDVRGIIFGAVLKYLKRYEVDCKNFLEELKKP